MPFRLANAPATFQAMMNFILQDLVDQGVVCYLDDILIYSKTKEEHTKLLKKVLQRLREYGLADAIDKCKFYKKEIEFLSYIVNKDGLKMSVEKLGIIRD